MREQSVDEPPGVSSIADRSLLEALTPVVARAAAVTLELRSSPNVRIKPDRSPVTDADLRSQAILMAALPGLLPGVDVVAEEMTTCPSQLGDVFVLIDPLDGTREYIAGSSEFTVNLALVQDGVPVAGIVAVPSAGSIYRGAIGLGAERLAMAPDGTAVSRATPVAVRKAPQPPFVAAISRSHLDTATVDLLDRLGVAARVPCGSALKFCRVAEGAADLYPRLAPTCEWDVAAGHALVAAAGGSTAAPDGSPLHYGASDRAFRIGAFIAWGDRAGVLAVGG
jgi:3'(2'), 5'-bisphosphate nucleotidase